MNISSSQFLPHHQAVYHDPMLACLEPYVGWVVDQSLQTRVNQVFHYYHDSLLVHDRVVAFLDQYGINEGELLSKFGVGFVDRTLGKQLPCGKTEEGHYQRGRLQQSGLLLGTGGEFFRGCLVFPVVDKHGDVVEAYGQRITRWLRPGTEYYLYWSQQPISFFNHKVLAESDNIILCKNPLEAMTLLCAGFSNVVATLGLRGFSAELLNELEAMGTRRITLAFDNCAEGDHAANLVAQALNAYNIECLRLSFPRGMDVCAFRASHGAQALRFLIRGARPFKPCYESLMGGLSNGV